MDEIPLSQLPNQEFTVLLDDQRCTINLYQKGLYMYLDLTVDGELVSVGNICQDGASILQSPTPLFNGSLHFYDLQGTKHPVYSGLGTRYLLVFVPDGEDVPVDMRF